jgi:hypothetical protein
VAKVQGPVQGRPVYDERGWGGRAWEARHGAEENECPPTKKKNESKAERKHTRRNAPPALAVGQVHVGAGCHQGIDGGHVAAPGLFFFV